MNSTIPVLRSTVALLALCFFSLQARAEWFLISSSSTASDCTPLRENQTPEFQIKLICGSQSCPIKTSSGPAGRFKTAKLPDGTTLTFANSREGCERTNLAMLSLRQDLKVQPKYAIGEAGSTPNPRWFLVFDGWRIGHPSIVLLGRARCKATGSKGQAAAGWSEANEVLRTRMIDNTYEKDQIPGCWRPDADHNKYYCRVDKNSNEIGDVCMRIADQRFTTTRAAN